MGDGLKVLVFVYGTLMRCFWNYTNLGLDTQVYIGSGYTYQKGEMVADVWPFADFTNEVCNIQGEIYLVTPDKVKELDLLEIYPGGYERSVMEVVLTQNAKGIPL